MMKDVLRQLCTEVGWSYAVFWRAIGAPNPTHFVWEDGFCQPTRGISGFEAMDLLLKEQGLVRNSSNGNFAELGCQTEDKVRALFQVMPRQINVLGDGIVGQAASHGDHHWILRDNIGNYGSSPNVLAELHNEFVSGIQTIVVIPVLPFGVAQLGSEQMVMEDVGFVNHVRSLLANLGRSRSLFVSSTSKLLRQKSQIFGIPETGNMGTCGMRSGQSSFTMLRDKLQTNAGEVPLSMTSGVGFRSADPISTSTSTLSIANSAQILSSRPLFQGSVKTSDSSPLFGISESMGNVTNVVGNFCGLQGGAAETAREKHETSNSEGSRMSNLSIFDGGYQNVLNSRKFETELDNNFDKQSSKFDANEFFYEPQFGSVGYDGRFEQVSPFLMAPTSENDLFDVVGMECRIPSNSSDLVKLKDEKNDFVSGENSSLNPLDCDIAYSGIFLESEPEQLLDAVVSKFNSDGIKQIRGESMSCKTSMTTASSSLEPISGAYGDMNSSQQKQGEFSISEGSSQKYGGYKSQISLWVENGQKLKSSSTSAVHCKSVEESGKLNRKRARFGESSRPRPKDRQMIQDRIKELRDIVPNGAKCSIDALLEKTIKHMLFLQCVTKHGDNLKDTGEPKIINKEGGLLLKDNFEGGATWAFEVGTQSTVCPIIVEDLNPPRQMLVEMLCEERGFFLEIADLIRGLGLSILKGVMEARKDKIWARFAVEANRDVTRMEIFLSLVRLLEPSAAGSIAQDIDKGNIKMRQNVAYQSINSVIPVTGSSNCLI